MHTKSFSLDVGGKTLTATFSDLAERAHGSVLIKYGNTTILATAVMSKTTKEGSGNNDFLPLSVEYEEKFYASGKILGSRYMRREGRPSDEAILSGRIVDRTIRPLFDSWIRNEIQVVISVLSIDQDDPDVLSVIGTSLALAVSPIPWNGPASSVRIAKLKTSDQLLINPDFATRESADLEFEMITCGKDGQLNMIELGGKEIPESLAVKALYAASVEIEKIQIFQKQIVKEIGKEKIKIEKPRISSQMQQLFDSEVKSKIEAYAFSNVPGDEQIETLRGLWIKLAVEKCIEDLAKGKSYAAARANELFEESINAFIHNEALTKHRRTDGRSVDEIRPLFAQAGGISPILHGSGIFYRGQTHIFSALTLGGPKDGQIVDGIEEHTDKRFIHHYNFPPFSTGETGRVGGLSRRSVGHGALAEKALTPIVPSKTLFPYTIRIVSEALSSNGSTSMASVCASTIALMDGGVPISRPAAGISIGAMTRVTSKGGPVEYVLLTDIQGPEDHYGDMDFKVAGTKNGITAIQMDIKVSGMPIDILVEAFEKAKVGRYQIIDLIQGIIPAPRKDISSYAPKILTLSIKPEQIGLVIGPGGKTINGIKDATGAEAIDIEDDGTVFITGKNGSAQKAFEAIYGLVREFKPGERFQGTVTKILEFGAFVKIAPNADGLVHISEIAPFKIDKIRDYLKEGDVVPVIIKEIDEKKRLNLSIKAADEHFIKPKA